MRAACAIESQETLMGKYTKEESLAKFINFVKDNKFLVIAGLIALMVVIDQAVN